jgi:Family of unknown function (DUF5990)
MDTLMRAVRPHEFGRADADSVRWDVEVRTVNEDYGLGLRGPVVHGGKGERFPYLTWGDVGSDGSFAMFRRAKLMVSDIEPSVLSAAAHCGVIVASLSLTDECGGPRCARVRPPVVRWSAGDASTHRAEAAGPSRTRRGTRERRGQSWTAVSSTPGQNLKPDSPEALRKPCRLHFEVVVCYQRRLAA